MMKKLLLFIQRLQNDQSLRLPSFSSYHQTEVSTYLRRLMTDNYTVANLKNVTPDQFQFYITSLPGQRDTAIEGYVNSAYQRDLSLQFE